MPVMRSLSVAAFALLLAACGATRDEIIFDDTVGPASKILMRDLPDTLHGDKDNARYNSTAEDADLKEDDPA